MVQIPLRRAHRLRAITLASPIKKLRPQPTERAPTAWHTNDEYKNAEASEEASASSAVANASENRILPIPTPRHWLHQSCSYKRVSSVGPFYDRLRAMACRAGLLLCSSNPLTACHQPSRPPPANITPMPSRAGQGCGFASGSLCARSGHSLSTTARISSEMTVTFSISSMYLCNRRKSAGVMILPSTTRGE
jgi:hypothetical protein